MREPIRHPVLRRAKRGDLAPGTIYYYSDSAYVWIVPDEATTKVYYVGVPGFGDVSVSTARPGDKGDWIKLVHVIREPEAPVQTEWGEVCP